MDACLRRHDRSVNKLCYRVSNQSYQVINGRTLRNPKLEQKRIALALFADGCRRAMSAENVRLIGKNEQLLANALHEQGMVTAGQIRPANALLEQYIPIKQHPVAGQMETDVTRRMARRIQHIH